MNNREIIKFQNIKFYSHPIYSKYSASKDGQILGKNRKKILKLGINYAKGYKFFILYMDNISKIYLVSRFVYECFKGNIPDDKEVDHIDNNKENNSIKNLQLLTHKENIRKSRCKKVTSFNIETREEKIFESLKEAAEYYQIHNSTVCLNCQKKIKTTKSNKDGMIYIFTYLDKSI